ncbi:hypothetical protein VSS74_14955 [Conexibacter stalactiti]|uniref:Uncharacterized protein n=1 Tax=Conexibacter stalactiti TaxID=1940611 RepID=A0ABU4HQW2_9ACTN|nr:hypothetical protein [Conexibacter stalactiti]MDW5595647.1 hypothetical protein [Conexibacter stalactiti]MEC5036289.1 hypothetical protein [Conexibacter stalactiti]
MNERVRVALQLLGAVAGLAALATLAGGAIVLLRFEALDMPADQALNLLPKQLLLITGLHALALPVAVAILCALPLALLVRARRKALAWMLFALIALGVIVRMVAVMPEPADAPLGWTAIVVLLLAGAITAAVAIAKARPIGLSWILLATFAVAGAGLAVVRTWVTPKLEPVALLTDGRPSSFAGFYVGQTSDRVYIAPLPGGGAVDHPFADAPIVRIAEIRRDRVLALVLRAPAGLDNDQSGRRQAQSLLADLRAATAPADVAEPVNTADPVRTFAPLVSLHADERSLPMSADDFVAHSRLVWAISGCTPLRERSFDMRRLAGPDAYAHRDADERCREADDGPLITAADHTRPFDTKDRPAGLGPREGFALDVDDEWRAPKVKLLEESGQKYLPKTPLYVEQHPDEAPDGKPAKRITYWLFYGLSQPPGPGAVTKALVHEGDWERISVLVRETAADRWQPLSVTYHFHDENRDVPWASVTRSSLDGGLHPYAFSALGSHATYWVDGDFESLPKIGGTPVRAPIYDHAMACGDCAQWRTWENVVDVRARPWYGFGGAWGAIGKMGGTTGPLGPSTWKIRDPGNSPTDTVHRPLMPSPVQATPPADGTAPAGG